MFKLNKQTKNKTKTKNKNNTHTAIMITGQLRVFSDIENDFFNMIKCIEQYTNVVLFFYVSDKTKIAEFHRQIYATRNNISLEESALREKNLYPTSFSTHDFHQRSKKRKLPYVYRSYDSAMFDNQFNDCHYSLKSSRIQVYLEKTCLEDVFSYEKLKKMKFDSFLRIRPDYLLNNTGLQYVQKYYSNMNCCLTHWNFFYLYPRKYLNMHLVHRSQILDHIHFYCDKYNITSGDLIDCSFKFALIEHGINCISASLGNVYPVIGRFGK